MSQAPSNRELPTDRLATSDKVGRRVYLYPAEAYGRYARARAWVHRLLILVFLAAPWLKINNRQAVLLDVANRQFSILGITFWAHDVPMLFFVIGGAALTLGLLTALWGRLWCGWACPQTVFIDSVFRAIERFIEGDHLARRKLDNDEWDGAKLFKKSLKWTLFTAATLVVAHSFLAYFVGTEELARMIRRSPAENPVSFGVMLFITGGILFDFGWFREQFCTVLCPYGRFQSLLMDEHSRVIVYDEKRGEPRKGTGDCVNCYRCVQVCPTGIDIRRGTQLECIGCTACIDACDDVMERLKKPRGLIRYDSAAGLCGKPPRALRARTIAYAALILAVIAGLAISLATRKPIEAAFVRAAESPYQELQLGNETLVLNRFKVDLNNQSFYDRALILRAEGAAGRFDIVTVPSPIPLKAGGKIRQDVFIKFPKSLLTNGTARLSVVVADESGQALVVEEVPLVGPYR